MLLLRYPQKQYKRVRYRLTKSRFSPAAKRVRSWLPHLCAAGWEEGYSADKMVDIIASIKSQYLILLLLSHRRKKQRELSSLIQCGADRNLFAMKRRITANTQSCTCIPVDRYPKAVPYNLKIIGYELLAALWCVNLSNAECIARIQFRMSSSSDGRYWAVYPAPRTPLCDEKSEP
jgi:hypothetical protein